MRLRPYGEKPFTSSFPSGLSFEILSDKNPDNPFFHEDLFDYRRIIQIQKEVEMRNK